MTDIERESLDEIRRRAAHVVAHPTPLSAREYVPDPTALQRNATNPVWRWIATPWRREVTYLQSFDARDILALCDEVVKRRQESARKSKRKAKP